MLQKNSELEILKDNLSKGILEQLTTHNLNQKELADILGVDNSTVGKWINKLALPRMGVIQKLSDYFQVSKSYFLEGINTNETSKYSIAFQKLINTRNINKLDLIVKISEMTDEEAEALNKFIK